MFEEGERGAFYTGGWAFNILGALYLGNIRIYTLCIIIIVDEDADIFQ